MEFVTFQNVTLKYLSKKCRNQKYQESLRTKKGSSNTESAEPDASQSVPVKVTENDLNYFKSVVVAPDTMEAIIEKLKLTAEFRAKKVKDIKFDFLEQYPIFYTHPILVN